MVSTRGSFLSDIKVLQAFMMSQEVSFVSFVSLCLNLKSSKYLLLSIFFISISNQGSRHFGKTRILPFDAPSFPCSLKYSFYVNDVLRKESACCLCSLWSFEPSGLIALTHITVTPCFNFRRTLGNSLYCLPHRTGSFTEDLVRACG